LPPSDIPAASIVRQPRVSVKRLSGSTGGNAQLDFPDEPGSLATFSEDTNQELPAQQDSLELAVDGSLQTDSVKTTTTPVEKEVKPVTANSTFTEAAAAELCTFETKATEPLQPSEAEGVNGLVSSPTLTCPVD